MYSFPKSRHGFTMLPLIMFMFVIVGLISAGYLMLGPKVQLGKAVETKAGLEKAVDTIISWSVANGRLPVTAEFSTIFGSAPLDSWGNGIVYSYDDNLSSVSTGGICGRSSTSITQGTTTSVAFLLLSQAGDSQLTSTPSTTGPYTGNLNNLSLADLTRIVTLDELKARAGCYGRTGGRLTIVNNELPSVCVGGTYNAAVYATGGVPPYSWTATNPPPSWLTPTGQTTGISRVLTNVATITSPAINSVIFTLTDDNYNSVSRVLPIKVLYTSTCAAACAADSTCAAACAADSTCAAACPACLGTPPGSPGNPITFNPPGTTVTDNWNGGTANDQGTNNTSTPGGKFDMTVTDGTISAISVNNGTTANCIWFQHPLTLTGKKLRAYFQFVYQQGPGFAFALAPAAAGQTVISSCDDNSHLGFGPDIPGSPLLGAEFIVNDWNSGTGTGSNCVAVDQELCTPAGAGINSWATGTTTYYARIELDATVTPYVYKVWLTQNASYKPAFQELSAPYPATGLPADIKFTSRTLGGIMDTFFLGFTTGQHGNDHVSMTLSGLKFELH